MKKNSFLTLLGLVMFLVSWNSNGYAQSARPAADNVLGVKVPKIETFVRVTSEEGTDVFKSPTNNSPWLVIWLGEDEEDGQVQTNTTWSDEAVPSEYTSEKSAEYADNLLMLLGEEDNFWKVNIFKNYAPDLEVGYIRKSDAELVKFEALTADMIKAPNQHKLSPTIVKTGGKYAGLVIDVGSDEAWGEEWLDVGVLANGMIVAPVSSSVTLIRDDEQESVKCVYDTESGVVLMYYPESMLMDDQDGFGRWFDPAKLTDKQIGQMLEALSRKQKSEWVRCECRIPGGDDSRISVYLKN